jgi:hypothetical protein
MTARRRRCRANAVICGALSNPHDRHASGLPGSRPSPSCQLGHGHMRHPPGGPPLFDYGRHVAALHHHSSEPRP